MMQVPFLNLAAQYRDLKGDLLAAVEQTLGQGSYVLGEQVAAFEAELAAFVGTKFGVGVNSGSDSLTLSLRGLGIGPGDEVITTPFTYIAPAESIYQTGARIVFADIDRRSFNLDPGQVERRLSRQTKAIIPVHLFGQAASMGEMLSLVKGKGIDIVEDCAQAIGATYQGHPVGSLGRVGCFSFYPTKNLGAAGDGGMVVTGDEGLTKRLRMLRVHGMERRYHHDLHGYNSRLDELQAAILRVKLRHLRDWNARRAEIAKRYSETLAGLPLELPQTMEGNSHVYHVYAVLTTRRDALQSFLAAGGVSTIIYYPQPLHLQKLYAEMGFKAGQYPVAESVANEILPLPIYPEMSWDQVEYVGRLVRKFFDR